jgi:hypothetical protein
MNKTFSLRTILTVTTGRLLTKRKGPRDNGIGDLHEILGHMTSEAPFTHTLPRFADECKPYLLKWFPELENANDHMGYLDTLLDLAGDEQIAREMAVESYIEKCISEWGMKNEYEIGQIDSTGHISKNPLTELAEMMQK